MLPRLSFLLSKDELIGFAGFVVIYEEEYADPEAVNVVNNFTKYQDTNQQHKESTSCLMAIRVYVKDEKASPLVKRYD